MSSSQQVLGILKYRGAATCNFGPAWSRTADIQDNLYGPSLVYSNGLFMVGARSAGGLTPNIWSSTDAITWITSTTPPAFGSGFGAFNILSNGAGIWLGFGDNTTVVAKSIDGGLTWANTTGQPVATKPVRYGGWYGNGQFAICTAAAVLLTTPDGNSPISQTIPTAFNTGVFAPSAALHLGCSVGANTIYSSANLSTWVLRGTCAQITSFRKIVSNGGAVLAAIDGTTARTFVAWSNDSGATWQTTVVVGIAQQLTDLIYNVRMNIWLVTDKDGFVYVSKDNLATFSPATSSLNPFNGNAHTWFMAVDSTGFRYASISDDNTVPTFSAPGTCGPPLPGWYPVVMPNLQAFYGYNSIAYGNNRFVTGYRNVSTNLPEYAYSLDKGFTWITVTPPTGFIGAGSIPTSVEYLVGAAMFIAGSQINGRYQMSPDGITWTDYLIGGYVGGYTQLSKANDLAFVVSNGFTSSIYSSSDGLTWVQATLPVTKYWVRVAWNGSRYMCFALDGTVAISTDRVTWVLTTTLPAGASGWAGLIVATTLGRFVISTPAAAYNKIVFSDDNGTTWNETPFASPVPNINDGLRLYNNTIYATGSLTSRYNQISLNGGSNCNVSGALMPSVGPWMSCDDAQGNFVAMVLTSSDNRAAHGFNVI